MPELGDVVTPQLVVSGFGETTVAALVIVEPSGTQVPGTGEASEDDENWTADPVTLDAAGVWCLRWTVTGDGAGVTEQYLTVDPAGTGAELPPAFATVAQAIAHLPAGKTLTAAELQALPGKLSSAAVKLRGFIRPKRLAEVVTETIAIQPRGNTIWLPRVPVIEVISVAAITRDGDVALDGWYFDGIDRIYLGRPWPDELAGSWDETAYSYRVEVESGGSIPEFLVDKNIDLALRHLLSKSPVAGVVNEKIGQYSYLMQQGSGTAGNEVRLTDDDRQELIEAGFRRTAGSSTILAV